jgi:16S rRNA A1518/A1519 N6-dimethyltransferase RsmA/KsgA/DIM1 with predicted DNA glycosylase/AP lyase activity
VMVLEADIFDEPPPTADHVVFASPPFDRTADIVRRLVEADVPPRRAFLVLQREAAQRFLGEPRRTLASVVLAPWFAGDVVHRFAPSDFTPQPAVDVVLVRLERRSPPLVPGREAQLYRDLVVTCFVSGRSLLDTRARPAQMTIPEWLDLYRRFRMLPSAVRRSVTGAEARLRWRQRARRPRQRSRPRGPSRAVSRSSRACRRWSPPGHPRRRRC